MYVTFDVGFSFCWFDLEVDWHSLEQNIWLKPDVLFPRIPTNFKMYVSVLWFALLKPIISFPFWGGTGGLYFLSDICYSMSLSGLFTTLPDQVLIMIILFRTFCAMPSTVYFHFYVHAWVCNTVVIVCWQCVFCIFHNAKHLSVLYVINIIFWLCPNW